MILDSDYRNLAAVSNSSMKHFREEGPFSYFNNFVDPARGEAKEWSTESTDIGDLVDCLLTNKELFNTFYYISGGVKGSVDLKAVLDTTWQRILAYLTDKDVPGFGLSYEKALQHEYLNDANIPFVRQQLVKSAREITTSKGEVGYRNNYKDEEKLANLLVADGGNYYSDLGIANGRKILDQITYETAVACKDSLLNDDFIGRLFKIEEPLELRMQYMLTTTINGVPCKTLLDYCLFDHKRKVIYPKDVKTAMSHKQFRINYSRYDYANQGSFYSGVLKAEFPEYTIAPFEFIVGTTQSGEDPMIYTMSLNELAISRDGAQLKSGRTIQGWMNTIADIKWHEERGNWRYPREYYEKGHILLNTYANDAVDSVGDGAADDDVF